MIKVLHLIPKLEYFGGTAKKLRFLLNSPDDSVCHFCAVGSLEGANWLGDNVKPIPLRSGNIILLEVDRVISLVMEKKIDLIVAHFFHMGMVAFGVFLRTKIPYIYQDHGIDIGENFIKYPLRVLMMMKAKVIVLNSYATKKKFFATYPIKKNKYRLVYNGIDDPLVSDEYELRKNIGLNAEQLLVGTIGGFLGLRRQKMLIHAFAKALKQVSDLHLVFLGEGGSQEAEVKTLAKKTVEERVHFVPRTQYVGSFLSALDIYVNASVDEGFGIATCEAMLMGKPVIANKSGALPEYCLNMFNALLVESDSVDELAEAIVKLSDSKDLRSRLGCRAAKYISTRFTPELYVLNNNAVCYEALAVK